MISSRRHITLATYLIVAVALADQLAKHWVRKTVQDSQGFRVMDHLNIVLVLNHGITFGFMQEMAPRAMPFVLMGAIALILAILGRWLWRTTSGYVAFSLGLIMGGAIGNVIDRVRYGAVIDFLDFYYKNYHWWAFNIADAAIVTGVTLLVFDSLFRGR